MRRAGIWPIVVAIAAVSLVVAQSSQLPVDEEAIAAEMEALIDATPDADAATRQKALKLIKKGVKAHDARRFDEAITLYQRAREIHPLDGLVYYELSLTYSKMGKQREALDAIVRALVLNPKDELYYVTKANTLDDLGFRDLALKAYRELLDVQPESFLGHVNYGITLLRIGEYEQADAAFLRAIEIDPDHPSGYFHSAKLCSIRGYDYDERAHLEKFVEVGKQDPRYEAVETRLEELNQFEVALDPDHPHLAIHASEELARVTWKSMQHRETFPDARGYELTFEEDKDVYTTVLAMWREKKAEDPEAAHGRWDLLLRIDDAGFLDEYIWYHRQRVFGDRATRWISSHQDRIEAFLEWARAEDLLKEEPAEETRVVAIDRFRGYVASIFELIEESTVVYEIHSEENPTDRLLRAERERFGSLKLEGDDRVACRRVLKNLDVDLVGRGAKALLPVFRCFVPGDRGYEQGVQRAASLGLELREIEFRPTGHLEFGDPVKVHIGSAPWLVYVLTKAAWRRESDFRTRNGGPENGERPTLAEELVAVAVTAGAYANTLEPDEQEQGEPPEPEHVPALDRLLDAVEADQLRGYVLYEVVHKAYGLPLDRLSESDAEAVSDYLFGQVIFRKHVTLQQGGQGR